MPLILAALAMGVLGVIIYQVLLSWNQGQELRQALITIALVIILADQMLAHFGGIAKDIKASELVADQRQPAAPGREHRVLPADDRARLRAY